MDTGMSDGGTKDEINRLNNFITGGNENPTAMQPGPIGKAEQTAIPSFPAGSPAVTNLLLTDPDADMPARALLLLVPADGGSMDPAIALIGVPAVPGMQPRGPRQRSLSEDAAGRDVPHQRA
jgi:hypothetical protein